MAVELQTFGVRGPDEFDGAFAEMTNGHAGALLVLPDPMLAFHETRVVELANERRLPSMYGLRDHVVAKARMLSDEFFPSRGWVGGNVPMAWRCVDRRM